MPVPVLIYRPESDRPQPRLDRDAEEWAATLIVNPYDIWFAVGERGYLRAVIDNFYIARFGAAPTKFDAADLSALSTRVLREQDRTAGPVG